jgi:hypothetical protein
MNCAEVMSQVADPWSVVVSSLAESARCQPHALHRSAVGSEPAYGSIETRPASTVEREHGRSTLKKNVRVSFVERLGEKSVSITWHDSTAACYGEQPWKQKCARSSGMCALTGLAIRPGDQVYGLASRTSVRPLNCTQMILAAVVEDLERRSTVA